MTQAIGSVLPTLAGNSELKRPLLRGFSLQSQN